MPHGHLTPLGRQFRSVLASLSHHRITAASNASTSTSCHRPRLAPVLTQSQYRHPNPTRFLCTTSVTKTPVSAASYSPFDVAEHDDEAPAANALSELREDGRDAQEQFVEDAFVIEGVEAPGLEQVTADSRQSLQPAWRRVKRRPRIDHLTEALRDIGKTRAVPRLSDGQLDYTYVSPRSPTPRRDLEERRKRHQHDYITPVPLLETSLQRILASYLRHQHQSSDGLQADRESPSTLSDREAHLLRHNGFNLEDVSAWAQIVLQEDTLLAAGILLQQSTRFGPESVPIFVYLHLLRRQYCSTRALRVLIRCTSDLFVCRARRLRNPGLDNQPVFVAVNRLLRHAREVWPQAMSSIVNILLRHLQHQREMDPPLEPDQLAAVAHFLNRAMALVSYSTALHPFKDNPSQEEAVVQILSYMATHSPPLLVDRTGYRAVIRVQLVQKKTETEQEWAGLKALSWPPWKSDRTAMDARIDAQHGVTKAGHTLARMQEAGYRLLNWEKTAQVYAGWDIDRTPTIQLRALLGPPQWHVSQLQQDNFTPWAARIASTRTVQEAWACYLAWEHERLPHNFDVYYAIFRKLSAEDKRQRMEDRGTTTDQRPAWPLLPGDAPVVSPLPPSAHLYTYTPTAPPALDEFYDVLSKSGVVFRGYCLGFLIEHAPTLRSGLVRLRDSSGKSCLDRGFTKLDPESLQQILPSCVYTAIVKLLTRFAKVPVATIAPEFVFVRLRIESANPLVFGYRLSPNSTMSHAIEMVRSLDAMSGDQAATRALCTSIVQALAFESNFPMFHHLLYPAGTMRRVILAAEPAEVLLESSRYSGAFNAYLVLRGMTALLRARFIDLDALAFLPLCVSLEHMVIAAWAVLQQACSSKDAQAENSHSELDADLDAKLRLRAEQLLQSNHGLGDEFKILVGEDSSEDAAKHSQQIAPSSGGDMPRLLVTPSPAVLHGYIRALGWSADFDGLLVFVQWMYQHRAELAESRERDRLGRDMTRKVVVALRVFLERSWLSAEPSQPHPDQNTDQTDDPLPDEEREPARAKQILHRLRSPASPDLIAAVKEIVEQVEDWEGWPSDQEVKVYAQDKRFRRVRPGVRRPASASATATATT